MADCGDDSDSQLAATGALVVGLAATISERGHRERTLEALEVAADLLYSESSSCEDREDTLEEKSKMDCRDEARHGRFQESATAKSVESRCRHMRIGPDAFTDLQELYACVLLGFAWKDFVEVSLKVQTADSEESFVQLAMDSDIADARRSHLICHASEGFFLPVQDEISPVFDDSGRVPGGWVGTSGQLLAELAALSPVLDIALRPLRGAVRRGGGFDVSEDALARLRKCTSFLQNQAPRSSDASFRDQETRLRNSVLHTWFVLFEGARLSQETGSALILHVPPHQGLA